MYDVQNLVNIDAYPIHVDGEKRDAVLKKGAIASPSMAALCLRIS